MIRNKILILLLATLFTGCDAYNELSSIGANAHMDTVWTFTQFNVTEEGDTIDSYYYYGEISKKLYKKIISWAIWWNRFCSSSFYSL